MTGIALQLYSVATACAADLQAALSSVARLGFGAVEFAGLHGHNPDDVRIWLDEAGLAVAGMHVQLDDLHDPARAGATAGALGTDLVLLAGVPDSDRWTSADWLALVDTLNLAAHQLAPLRVGYHLHDVEFRPLLGGERPLDWLLSRLDPAVVVQLDTGHAARVGADPVTALRQIGGRAVTIHLQEWSPEDEAAPLGSGAVPLGDVIRLAKTLGTRWWVVERERFRGNTFAALGADLARLTAAIQGTSTVA